MQLSRNTLRRVELVARRSCSNSKVYDRVHRRVGYGYTYIKELLKSDKMVRRKDVLLERVFGTVGNGFAIGAFVLGIIPVFAYAASYIFDMKLNVRKTFERPSQPRHRREMKEYSIQRWEVMNEVTRAFVNQTDTLGLVGVIFGPAGTGKSSVVRAVCRMAKCGAVYVEIGSHCQFAYYLAEACGIPVEQRNWYDALASKFFPDWKTVRLKLPDNDEDALALIIPVIAEGCRAYKSKHGHVPTLFIDGADILANQNSGVFKSLVEWAKKCANDNTVQIVLISSDSHVVRALDQQSFKCRLGNLIEIEDVREDEAMKLMKEKFMMEEYLAKRIYDTIGGRLSDIHKAVSMWKKKNELPDQHEHASDIKRVIIGSDDNSDRDMKHLIFEKMRDSDWEKQSAEIEAMLLPRNVIETANTIQADKTSEQEMQEAIFCAMDGANNAIENTPDSQITNTSIRLKVRKLALKYKWLKDLVDEIECQSTREMEQALCNALGNAKIDDREWKLKMAILKEAVHSSNDHTHLGASEHRKPRTVEDIQWCILHQYKSESFSTQEVMDAVLQFLDNNLLRITKQRVVCSYNKTAQKVLQNIKFEEYAKSQH